MPERLAVPDACINLTTYHGPDVLTLKPLATPRRQPFLPPDCVDGRALFASVLIS
jgi:hypothetical protein